MKSNRFLYSLALFPGLAGACTVCQSATGKMVRSEIFAPVFVPHLLMGLVTPLMVYFAISFITRREMFKDFRGSLRAGLFLGAGLGGLMDAFLFRQILQMHMMASNLNPLDDVVHLEVNMFWDGYFYMICLALAAVGVVQLWRSTDNVRTWSLLGGSLLSGWGVFSFFEGIINHEIFQIHHINERVLSHQGRTDLLYLLFAVALIYAGYRILKMGKFPRTRIGARENYSAV